MKTFAVYQKGTDDIILVQEGFNIVAAIFSSFWALYNKIWPLFALGTLLYMLQFMVSSSQILIGLKVFTFLLFGLLSDFIYGLFLERQGYVLVEVINAKDSNNAELTFYERCQKQATSFERKNQSLWEE
ncbi:MAG: hypothetical protein K0Q51_911 [Rickettsiaceae bacterium]|jgi:hypothetical protein|nr:hypothetical protein [Rickettsiaceae bacterium]